MGWPTSQDYNEAIQNAASCFSDPDLKKGEVTLNAIGLPVPRSGNFADVYKFNGGDGKFWAVKCFTRKVSGLQERYAKIDEHLSRAHFPFTVGFKYLAEGIRIRGEWHPLLKMEWVEGFTLNEFVRDNAGKPNYLHALMQMWGKLTGMLRDANFAHADLQHGNVLLVPGTSGTKLGLKLIDYDGMWVPALAETHSGEVGHPNFQHPLRLKDRLYNADVDRFPHLVIAAALRGTLLGGKPLWDKFDNGDNLLFKESDLSDPANSPVVKALWDLNDDVLCTLVGKLALASREPLRKAPWLDDTLFEDGGPKLGIEEEKKVLQMLGVKPHFTASKETAALAKPGRSEFTDFDVVDDDEPAHRRVSKENKKKKNKKEEKEKSKMPYYIGGGVLALLLLVGGIIAATSGGGKKATPGDTEVAKNDDTGTSPKVDNGSKKIDPRKGVTNDNKLPKTPVEVAKNNGGEGITLKDLWAVNTMPGPIAFLPDNSKVITQNGPQLRVHDIRDGSAPDMLRVDNPLAPRSHVCSDGTMILAYSAPPAGLKIMRWDPKTRQKVFEVDSDNLSTPFFGISEKHDQIYTPVRNGGGMGIFSLKDGKKVGHYPIAGLQPIFQALCAADGEGILVSTPPGAVYFRPNKDATFKHVVDLKMINGNTPIPVLSPDGKHFVHFNGGNSIYLYDMNKPQPIATLEGHTEKVDTVVFTNDSRRIVSVGDRTIRVWDVASAKQIKQIDFDEMVGMKQLGISSDGKILALSGVKRIGGGHLRTWAISGSGTIETPVIVKKDTEPKIEVKLAPPGAAPEIKEVWKNAENVHFSQFSRDGNTIVSVMTGTLLIHDAKTGNLLHSKKFADMGPLGVMPLPDGNLLVRAPVGGGKSETFSFNPKTEERRFIIDDSGFLPWMTAVGKNETILGPIRLGGMGVFSGKDGKKVAEIATPGGFAPNQLLTTPDADAMLIYHHPDKVFFRTAADQPWKQLEDLKPDANNSPNLRLAPNGKRYLHHSSRGPITVYSTATGKLEAEFEGHTDVCRRAVFTNDGRFVLSVGWDKTCRIWEVASGKEVGRIPVIGNPGDIAISPDGRSAVTCSNASPNGYVMQLWSIGDGAAPIVVKKDPVEPKKDVPVVQNAIVLEQVWKNQTSGSSSAFAFAPDGSSIVLAPRNAMIEKLKLADGTVMGSFKAAQRSVSSFKVCPNDTILVSETDKQDRHVALWDLKTGQKKFDFAPLWSVASTWADFANNRLLNPVANGEVEVYSLVDGKKADENLKIPVVGKDTPHVQYSNDGKAAALLHRGSIFIRAAGMETFKSIDVGAPKSHSGILLSPDGKYIVYKCADDPIRVWETASQKLIGKLEGHTDIVGVVCYTNDSKHLISGSHDKTLRVWDLAACKQIQSIALPGRGYAAVASPDGQHIATMTEIDNGIQLWRCKGALANPIVKKDPEPDPEPPAVIANFKNPYEGKEGLVKDSLPLTDPVRNCFYSIDLTRLYAVTQSGVVHVLDPITLVESAKFNAIDGRVVQAMAVRKVPTTDPPKELIYVLDDKKHVHVYDPEKKSVVKDLSFENQLNDPNDNIAFTMTASPDTRTLLLFSRRGFKGTSFDLTNNQTGGLPQLKKPNFGDSTVAATWSADTKYAAAATNGELLVWDAKKGEDIGQFKIWNIDHLALNSDATAVVSASSQMFVAFNFKTGKEIWNIKPTNFFAGLQAIPNSTWVAYSGPTDIVILDCKTGDEVTKWHTPENGARLLASRDGKFLVTWGGRENKVHLWAVPAKK